MNRLARVAVLALALIAGVVAAAQADDGSSGDGTSTGTGTTTKISRTALPAPAGTSTSTKTTTTKTTPANVTVTVPAAAVQPKTDDDGGTDAPPETKTDEDRPADQPDPETAPRLGEEVGVTPADGTVRVRTPKGEWAGLTAAANVPNGSVVDARQGTITLTTAVDQNGSEQAAKFSGAVFAFHQPSATHPVTVLELKGGDFSVCKRASASAHGAVAAAAARRKPVRRLFGSGHGRFRTEGRFAAATVHGTVWITEDYCDRTVITVKRGVVGVTDLRTGRVVNVHAGSSRTIRR